MACPQSRVILCPCPLPFSVSRWNNGRPNKTLVMQWSSKFRSPRRELSERSLPLLLLWQIDLFKLSVDRDYLCLHFVVSSPSWPKHIAIFSSHLSLPTSTSSFLHPPLHLLLMDSHWLPFATLLEHHCIARSTRQSCYLDTPSYANLLDLLLWILGRDNFAHQTSSIALHSTDS